MNHKYLTPSTLFTRNLESYTSCVVLRGWKTFTASYTDICMKKCHKNERHLCLVTLIFIKLSQIMCLIDIHIMVCKNAKCDCRL